MGRVEAFQDNIVHLSFVGFCLWMIVDLGELKPHVTETARSGLGTPPDRPTRAARGGLGAPQNVKKARINEAREARERSDRAKAS